MLATHRHLLMALRKSCSTRTNLTGGASKRQPASALVMSRSARSWMKSIARWRMQVDILYAHQDGLVTGSAISLRNLLAALNREIYEPRVAMFSEGPARELYEALGICVDVVPARPFWTFPGGFWTELSFYRNFLALLPNEHWKAYLEERRPGIVHVDDKSCLQAGIAAHQLHIPIVWHLRSSYAPSRSRLQAKISARVIRHRADRLIAISEDEMDGFEDCTNLSVIHNSLDLAEAS